MKRRWIFGLLVVAFVWVVVSRFAQIKEFRDTLAQGRWQFVLLAGLSQIIYFVVFSASYQAAFATVGVRSRVRDLLPVTLSSLFINVVAPSGGMAGAALFIDDLGQLGQPKAHITIGAFLQLIADYLSFLLVLLVGLVYLFTQHDLKTYEVIASLILVALTLGLAGIPALSLWHPAYLHRLMTWFQGLANRLAGRLKRGDWFSQDWAERTAAEFSEAAAAAAERPWYLFRTIGIALAAHLMNIVTLDLVFQAFRQPIDLWPLVAGYAIAILFLIVSITPQGIGVVEGVLTLTLTSMGISPAVSASIALVFRGITFWLPLVLGFLLLQRVKTFGAEEHSLGERWTVRFLAIMTGIMGVVNLLSAVTPGLAERTRLLRHYLPLSVSTGSHLTVALAGFALLLLAGALWRRKRTAWAATLVVLLLSAAGHLTKGLDYEEALLALGMAAWLVWQRAEFHARSDPPSIRQGVAVLGAALLFTLAYGVAGFYLLDRHYQARFGFLDAVRQTLVMFTEFYDPGLQPITGFGHYFADSIYVIGLATLGYAGVMLLRPVLVHQPASPDERRRAQAIVEAHGCSPLARFTLFPDKAYHFSPGGSVLAFALRQRVAVVLGDPIGPPEDLPAAIASFQEYCRHNDWIPAFYQTLPETLEAYRQAGFEAVPVGQEAIVDLASFSLAGRAFKQFRTAESRMARTGHSFHVHQPGFSEDLLAQLREVSDEWLTHQHGSEKRFSLGWFDEAYLSSTPVATVCNEHGHVMAFANLVSEYQRNELSIDLMRHRQVVEPGTMDYLFTSIIAYARQQGYDSFNLGLSALAGVGEHSDDPAVERVLHFIYEHVNQFYNFRGLHEFKDKFQPSWSPRYLIYPNLPSLAQVWLAVVEANSGD